MSPRKSSTSARGAARCSAASLYDVRLELQCADLISGRAEFKATLERHRKLEVFLKYHPELEIGIELIEDEDHQDAYLFFDAGKIPQVAVLLAQLDQPIWRKRRLLYGDILYVPNTFPEELAKLVTKRYGWRVKRGAV